MMILAILVMCFGSLYLPVRADSGWDSDYDFGSDSGWDSDYDSGWDSDYDNDWGSGSSSTGGHISWSTFIIFMVVIITIMILVGRKNGPRGGSGSSVSNYNDYSNDYDDIDIEKLHEFDKNINIDELKVKIFNIYKDIQVAWMNFDTDTIRKLTTDELYNMYKSQLETLKLKKQQNIMEDIELIDVKIIDIKEENKVITVDAYLNVKCYDYVIKENTKEVVRGKDNVKINIKYKVSFVKSAINNNKKEKCPNCGAPVDIISSAKCPYCDSTLVKNASDYVMSKKTSLSQTLER